jgi:16S rRNA (cytosine1402-N4)-methyltransferase
VSRRSVHRPVLLREVLRFLALEPGLVVVDGTVGGGGHAAAILKAIGPTGTLVGLDRDRSMLDRAAEILAGPNVHLIHASHADLPTTLEQLGIDTVDRVLLDLGLSSDQLASDRGFGFDTDGPLDLRFDETAGAAAWELLETLDEADVADALQRYGEERFAREIAAEIARRRGSNAAVRTTRDLVEAVESAIPGKHRRDARRHPATRVFQALRILANDELAHVERTLEHVLPDCLPPGGRAVVLSFHSLEDRLAKHAFRDETRWVNQTNKPVTAAPAERRINPRARSAKLRAAVRR